MDFVRLSNDLVVRYQKAGQGKQIVLLVPGWTMTSEVFEKQLSHFRDSADCTVFAIDPRSHGYSTHTCEGNFYEQHGRDLNAFICALDLKDVIIGGWSNGGFAMLSYVHQFGHQKLKGLVMIDAAPAGTGDDVSREWAWFQRDDANGFRKFFTQGALTDRAGMTMEFAAFMIENITPEYLDWITRITLQTADGVAAVLNESSAYQNYCEVLAALEGRVRLLYFVNADWAEIVGTWAKVNTPSAKVVAFGKHVAFWEHPDQFNSALSDMLRS